MRKRKRSIGRARLPSAWIRDALSVFIGTLPILIAVIYLIVQGVK